MQPLYEQVRASLVEAISSGRWKPGEALPSETRLAQGYGVAIGTLRKAVDSLVAQQALVRRQGKGTFVVQHDAPRLMFHFFHVAGRDGTRDYPEVATLDFRRERATEAEASALRVPPREKVIRIRNVLSLQGRAVIVDDITLPAALFPGLTEKAFVGRGNTVYHFYQSRFGINVLRTDERLRAVVAPADIARTLALDAGAPVLEITRAALTFRDRPVERRVSHVDTAHHHYHATLGKDVPA